MTQRGSQDACLLVDDAEPSPPAVVALACLCGVPCTLDLACMLQRRAAMINKVTIYICIL